MAMQTDDVDRLVNILANWKRPKVSVLGDVILDRYTWGTADRISPEAPVPVLNWDREDERPGGAAATAALLAGLGAEVQCVGFIGKDGAGAALGTLLRSAGVQTRLIVAEEERPTTVKHRFLSSRHGHVQLLRMDRESTDRVTPRLASQLLAATEVALASTDALAISDYRKGVCSPECLKSAIDAARAIGIPVLIDPARGVDFGRYAGASLLLPNRLEMEAAVGQSIPSFEVAMSLGVEWARKWKVDAIAIKLDREGIVLAQACGKRQHFPTRSRIVYDITGAGDTVLAAMATSLASGSSLEESCELANVAGGLQVERIGVDALSRVDIRRDIETLRSQSATTHSKVTDLTGALKKIAAWRAQGERIAFTNGCFAAIHAGHIAYLQEASRLADRLVVAINSSASVCRLKGDRPVISDTERLQLLAALSFIDCVFVFEEETPHSILRAVRPDVLAKGGATEEIIGQSIVESYGGRVFRLSMVDGVSTSGLISSSAMDEA